MLNISTNIASLNAQRQNRFAGYVQDKAYQRLASGLRINGAADDAAGLQISSRLTSEINGSNGAIRNANDAISVVNVADGALDESVSIMQRMRTLAIQSGSGANSIDDRIALNTEFKQLQQEMDRIATETKFAGKKLINGSYKGEFLIGSLSSESLTITDLNAQTKNLGEMEWRTRAMMSKPGTYNISSLQLSSQPLTLNGITFDKNYTTQEEFVADINNTSFPSNQGPVTAKQLPFKVETSVDLSALPSYIDIMGQTVDLTKIDTTGWSPDSPTDKNAYVMGHVIQAISTAIGSNFNVTGIATRDPSKNVLAISSYDGNSLSLDNGTNEPAHPALPAPSVSYNSSLNSLLKDVSPTTYIGGIELRSSGDKYSNIDMEGNSISAMGFYSQDKEKLTVDNIDILSEFGASRAIKTLDAGMKQVGVQRTCLGSQANALDARVRVLSNSSENLSAARSRIQDMDMAAESAVMVRAQIMQQASMSILSQANSRPNIALSLLQS